MGRDLRKQLSSGLAVIIPCRPTSEIINATEVLVLSGLRVSNARNKTSLSVLR